MSPRDPTGIDFKRNQTKELKLWGMIFLEHSHRRNEKKRKTSAKLHALK
jgi:hypothetical protein